MTLPLSDGLPERLLAVRCPGSVEDQETEPPIVSLTWMPRPVLPDTVRNTGTLGSITTGTGPAWMSIGAPSISPICVLQVPCTFTVPARAAVTLADALTDTPLGTPANPW